VSAPADPFALAGTVRLVRGREAALRRRHPWVYRGALASSPPQAGAVAVVAATGEPLATALVAAGGGSLALRVVAWPGETWSSALLRRRLAEAAALRARLTIDSDACRLVHAEGDQLPGLVVDRYGDTAVIEVFDAAWEPYLGEIAAFLAAPLPGPRARAEPVRLGEYPRARAPSPQRSFAHAGTADPSGAPGARAPSRVETGGSLDISGARAPSPARPVSPLAGACTTVLLRRGEGRRGEVTALAGAVPAAPIAIREGAVRLPVDLVAGHKTGFYLDQRDNRRRLGELSAGAEVLNLFSYSGAFALAALAGGAARAVNVDASGEALALARLGYRINGRAESDADFVLGDAFAVTRELVASGARYGVVVVDPPSFARRRGELPGALRGLKDINLQALRLVAPGGVLLSCSCSALVDHEAFAGALAAAAVDAGRAVRVLEVRGAAPDHPLSLACRETRHLQAWFCHVP
jgi:23S rRNA (cytosine1962-C5)-methyltransferase